MVKMHESVLIPTRTAQMMAPLWTVEMLDYGDHIEILINAPDEKGDSHLTTVPFTGMAPYLYARQTFVKTITRLIDEYGLR